MVPACPVTLLGKHFLAKVGASNFLFCSPHLLDPRPKSCSLYSSLNHTIRWPLFPHHISRWIDEYCIPKPLHSKTSFPFHPITKPFHSLQGGRVRYSLPTRFWLFGKLYLSAFCVQVGLCFFGVSISSIVNMRTNMKIYLVEWMVSWIYEWWWPLHNLFLTGLWVCELPMFCDFLFIYFFCFSAAAASCQSPLAMNIVISRVKIFISGLFGHWIQFVKDKI